MCVGGVEKKKKDKNDGQKGGKNEEQCVRKEHYVKFFKGK